MNLLPFLPIFIHSQFRCFDGLMCFFDVLRHALALWDGVRFLFRILYTDAARGSTTRSVIFPTEPQRSRF